MEIKETEMDAKASYSVLNAASSKLAHQRAPENHAGYKYH